MDAGIKLIDFANSLDGLDGITPSLLLTGCNREGEAVNDDVVNSHVPVLDQGINQS